MKTRYFVNKKGTKQEVLKLSPEEKHKLRRKNLDMLREQKLMEETVKYADYQVQEDKHV